MYKVVFDTNIFLSALIKNNGVCAKLFSSQYEDKYQLIISKLILDEITNVGNRNYFRKYFSKELLKIYINELVKNSIFIKSITKTEEYSFTDPNDKAVYDLYIFSNADFLITGNTRDFPKSDEIIQPNKFIDILTIR